ncbi:MAG TPA: type II secretion system protein [Candidatus Saccharimonadales bacterium]|nr:type II secretion system protein [Candidatus Saccharimonadales bacterium]
MTKQRGFTVLELIIAIVFLLIAGTIFYVQKRDLEVAKRDSDRKTAINQLYYNLEDVYYPANKTYPEKLTADGLKGVDPQILKDPRGITVGDYGSDYRYEPKDCKDGKCKSYILTANLEAEADFTKNSRNK